MTRPTFHGPRGSRRAARRARRRYRWSSAALAVVAGGSLVLSTGIAAAEVPAHGDGGGPGGGHPGGHDGGGYDDDGGHDGDPRHGGEHRGGYDPRGPRGGHDGRGPSGAPPHGPGAFEAPPDPPAPASNEAPTPAAPAARPSPTVETTGSDGDDGGSGPPASSGTCDLRSGRVATSEGRILRLVPSAASRVSYPCPYPPEWRGIRLGQSSIRFVAGGQLVGEIPFDGRGRVVGLDEVTDAIADPSWLAEVAPGVFELRATLVQAAGTTLAARAPRVTEVRLVDLPGVAIAGNRAHGIYEGVTVTSWDETAQAPDARSDEERPHVVYQNGSRLDVLGATFQYLGSDRTASYGVSWRRGGTTGTVVDSVFQHNYFGIYTYEAADMEIRANTVRHNVRYGIDPHDASSGLVVEGNDVYGNGSHGIIFSKFVHDSVVRDNVSRDNDGNGIMMDLHSNGNVIEGNRVIDNRGEGIVSSASADLVIRRNEVSGSEVGIRLSSEGADGVRAEGNVISGVQTGVKVYKFANDAVFAGNTIVGATVAGARIDSPGSVLRDNRVLDVPVGLDARAAVVVDGGVIEATERALDVSSTGNVSLPRGEFTGGDTGIRVERGGIVTRGTPIVRALDPVDGGGSSEGRTLSLAGLGLVAAAVVLQVAHSLRNRRHPRHALAPSHVRNTH